MNDGLDDNAQAQGHHNRLKPPYVDRVSLVLQRRGELCYSFFEEWMTPWNEGLASNPPASDPPTAIRMDSSNSFLKVVCNALGLRFVRLGREQKKTRDKSWTYTWGRRRMRARERETEANVIHSFHKD
jgi:hypothetical protein